MKITIIGTGYVGLVSGAGLAKLGHKIYCVDINKEKIAMLQKGQEPFYEPGLGRLLKSLIKTGSINFTTDLASVINQTEMVFICVGTPSKADGSADLTYVNQVVQDIAKYAKKKIIVVSKSTIPVGSTRKIQTAINKNRKIKLEVASCPEFLREGKALYDFLNPERIIVGADKDSVGYKVMNVFSKIKSHKMVTDWETTEMIKYASNSFLATKISFINEIANICDKIGANVEQVARGMGYDQRINPHYLKAGVGFGGSCFPKDVKAIIKIAKASGYDFKLMKSVVEINDRQRQIFVEKIKKVLGSLKGKTIGVLGLAFKDNTDDIRESAAIDIVTALNKAGARVKVYDPEAMFNAKCVLHKSVIFCDSAEEVLKNASAMVVATEWPIFTQFNWSKVKLLMKEPIIFDGRNILDRGSLEKLKFKYYGVGK